VSVYRLSNDDDSEWENRTVFSGCHEFLGESSLRFGESSENEQQSAQKREFKALALPPGLPFEFALTKAIDTYSAAAGDRVQAQLTSPIGDKHSGVLVPKGAAVTGRIVQMKRLYGRGLIALTMAFKLETLEVNGVPQPFDARLESAVKRRTTSDLEVRQSLGSFDQMFDPEDPGVGFLEFQDVSEHFVIKRGSEIEGVTAAPK
jgi:hypothetical protein